MVFAESNHWDRRLSLATRAKVIEELFFWKENIERLKSRTGFSLLLAPGPCFFRCQPCRVRSLVGIVRRDRVPVYLVRRGTRYKSTWRELKAVALAIRAFGHDLKGQSVRVLTDITGVEAILRIGSMKEDLQHMSIGDWGVLMTFFRYMDSMWEPHTVDRFADVCNTKLLIFSSKCLCPYTSLVDAFSASWEGHSKWLVPPVELVGQAVRLVKACSAVATLVVPAWPSAPFWPLLFFNVSMFSSTVNLVAMFLDPIYSYVQGRNRNSGFGSDRYSGGVICVRLVSR